MAQVRYETAEHLGVQTRVSQIYRLYSPVVPDQTANASADDYRVVFLLCFSILNLSLSSLYRLLPHLDVLVHR